MILRIANLAQKALPLSGLGFYLLIELIPQARAEFSIRWSEPTQSELEASGANQIGISVLDTIETSAPEKILKTLNRRFELEFGSFGGHDGFEPIEWENCPPEGLPASYRSENLARLTHSAISDISDFIAPVDRILLNPDFKKTLLAGFSGFRASCRHGADLNLLLGAIDHQLALAYDLSVETDTDFYQKLNEHCPNTPDQIESPRLPTECSALNEVKHLVSDRSPFLHLMEIQRGILGYQSQQLPNATSTQIHPLSPTEIFADTVEDFILESDFYCKKPGFFSFLSSHFELDLTPPKCLKPLEAPLFNRPGNRVLLDPSLIYRVEYLYVHAGSESLIESFGHAMLRVIACAPYRVTPGPECLEDTNRHYIITFYEGNQLDFLQSLLGNGISEAFIYQAPMLISNYTHREGRSIDVIPLALSKSQISTLIGLAWQWNQSYRTQWSDLNNNCVTQILDLLKASIPALEFQSFPFPTPASIADLLESSGLSSDPRSTLN